MNKVLIMTVGLPRSGKSTWAHKYSMDNGIPVVCPDAIRLALHGQAFCKEAEPWVWVIAKTMVKALFLAGHDKVILDSTMARAAWREPWFCDSWDTQVIYFDTPVEVCLERAGDNEGLVGAIKYMNENFDVPVGIKSGEVI